MGSRGATAEGAAERPMDARGHTCPDAFSRAVVLKLLVPFPPFRRETFSNTNSLCLPQVWHDFMAIKHLLICSNKGRFYDSKFSGTSLHHPSSSLVCISFQVTPYLRCTFSLPIFHPRELVDATTPWCVSVMENMWRITTRRCCLTFTLTPQSPGRWPLRPSLDMQKSSSGPPKLWRDIKTRSNKKRWRRLAQMLTEFKTN